MKKKILSLIASAAVLLSMAAPITVSAGDNDVSVWDGAVTGATGGYGWFNDPNSENGVRDVITNGSGTIHIDSAAKLAALALFGGRASAYSNYTVDQLKFEGVTFVLDTDIDLNGHAWSPICSYSATYPFLGTFDGQGHTIYGMSNKPTDTDGLFENNRNIQGKDYFGLIGFLAGTVKNVKIKNASWVYNGTATSMPAGGGIAAFLGLTSANSYRPQIDNCSVEDFTITFKKTSTPSHASHGFAGLAGSGWGGSVTNCYVKNFTIDLSDTTATPNCEGLIYYNRYMYNGSGGKFDIKSNYVLNANKKIGNETSKLPFIYYGVGVDGNINRSMNYTDCPEHVSGDGYPAYNADVDVLRENLARGSEASAYYSEGEGYPVVLKSEVKDKATFFELKNADGNFTAKANLSRVDDGTMLVIAVYDIVGDALVLNSISAKNYDRATEFNTVISTSLSSAGFVPGSQVVKAFVWNPGVRPYAASKTMDGGI